MYDVPWHKSYAVRALCLPLLAESGEFAFLGHLWSDIVPGHMPVQMPSERKRLARCNAGKCACTYVIVVEKAVTLLKHDAAPSVSQCHTRILLTRKALLWE